MIGYGVIEVEYTYHEAEYRAYSQRKVCCTRGGAMPENAQ